MSAEQGVPIAEVTARDHIQVRAALVRRLGGANQALVWARIYYRADDEHRAALEIEGSWWWQASYALLAEETGLTEKQARAAIDDLCAGGYVERRAGKGRALLYRPVVIAAQHLPSGADTPVVTSALEGSYIGPVGQKHLPSGALTPLIDTEDVKDTPVVPAAVFDEAWSHWPKKADKKLSRERFERALKKHPQLVADVVRFGDAYAATTPVEFVPGLAVWIGRERWTDPLPLPRGGTAPSPTDRALATIALGRQQPEQRAVGQ